MGKSKDQYRPDHSSMAKSIFDSPEDKKSYIDFLFPNEEQNQEYKNLRERYKNAFDELESHFIHLNKNYKFSSEYFDEKMKKVKIDLGSKSLDDNTDYRKEKGKVIFTTCFNMCLNLLTSSLFLSITGSVPIALISFAVISYKILTNIITKNNTIHIFHMERIENFLNKLNNKRKPITHPPSSDSLDKTDVESNCDESKPEQYQTPPRRAAALKVSCNTITTDRSPSALSARTDNELYSPGGSDSSVINKFFPATPPGPLAPPEDVASYTIPIEGHGLFNSSRGHQSNNFKSDVSELDFSEVWEKIKPGINDGNVSPGTKKKIKQAYGNLAITRCDYEHKTYRKYRPHDQNKLISRLR